MSVRRKPQYCILVPMNKLQKTSFVLQQTVNVEHKWYTLFDRRHASYFKEKLDSWDSTEKIMCAVEWTLSWWRHQMETFSALLAICVENSPVPGEFPAQRPVTMSFDVFFDLCPNKRLCRRAHYDVIVMVLGLQRCVVITPIFSNITTTATT